MQMADGDPLRAQEIHEEIEGLWYHRGLAWLEMRQLRQEKDEEQLERKKRRARRGR